MINFERERKIETWSVCLVAKSSEKKRKTVAQIVVVVVKKKKTPCTNQPTKGRVISNRTQETREMGE